MKLNPLGEIMNLPDAFDQIKKTKHDSSFEDLGEWLDQNTSKPKKMKTFYKYAASLIFAAMILIACTVPVQHEEEIGFMIKGISSNNESSLTENLKSAKSIFGKQVVMSFIIIEGFIANKGDGKESSQEAEVVLMLPKADLEEANTKMDRLNSIFNFDQVDLMPIEKEVEVPLYQAALSQVNLNFGKAISEEVLIERFNKVLHENSNVAGNAELTTDEDGNKVVEIIIEERSSNSKIKGALHELDPSTIKSISVSKDKNGNNVIDLDIIEQELKEQN
jgi:hypothetical protein